MSVTGISGTNLVQGSLTLTREQAEARGMTFHETMNRMTGERTETRQAPLSGYSLSLLSFVNAQENGSEATHAFIDRHNAAFGPTQGSLYRMDALRTAAAEDRPAVEQAFANHLAQAGIDPENSFTMTRTFNMSTHQYQVSVNHDYAKWREVENLLNNSPELSSDIQRIWGQQSMLANMEIVESVLQEGAGGDQDAVNRVWLDHGREDLALSQSLADTLNYRGGRIVSPSAEMAANIRKNNRE